MPFVLGLASLYSMHSRGRVRFSSVGVGGEDSRFCDEPCKTAAPLDSHLTRRRCVMDSEYEGLTGEEGRKGREDGRGSDESAHGKGTRQDGKD